MFNSYNIYVFLTQYMYCKFRLRYGTNQLVFVCIESFVFLCTVLFQLQQEFNQFSAAASEGNYDAVMDTANQRLRVVLYPVAL